MCSIYGLENQKNIVGKNLKKFKKTIDNAYRLYYDICNKKIESDIRANPLKVGDAKPRV